MNDKAKKILSYVACAIGGACLGIALLGGLSYCTTSPAREKTSEVNTIYQEPRRSKTTTENGGYTKYQFAVSPTYPTEAEKATIKWYSWDELNATTELTGQATLGVAQGTTGVNDAINTALTSPSNAPTGDEIKLVTITGYSTFWDLTRYWFYMTWYRTSVTGTWTANAYAFVPSNLSDSSSTLIVSLNNNVGAFTNMTELPVYFQGNEVTNFVWLTGHTDKTPQNLYVFQDVVSYYKEIGYTRGYSQGWENGWTNSPGGVSTDNVFSLFTRAFYAVGGFFNLEIFGFLPLYWFFLAPLFITLITLLLRMVKH